MALNLSEIERKILDFMVAYLRTNTYQPSIREIGERFGIKSTKTVSEHLQALADKGYLERDPSRSRGVKILGMDLSAQAVSVPCFSRLPDDRSGLRASRAETHLSVDQRLAGGNGAFFVQARADELGALGLMEGDFVLLEPAAPADVPEGAIVAARVEGKASYWRLSRRGQTIFLQPVAGKGDPTALEDSGSFSLLGRVTGMFRRMDRQPPSGPPVAH
jgi:repressor LexA